MGKDFFSPLDTLTHDDEREGEMKLLLACVSTLLQ